MPSIRGRICSAWDASCIGWLLASGHSAETTCLRSCDRWPSRTRRLLRSVNPEVPHALSDLVDRLLSKCPDDRPATAQIVVDELRAIEQGLPRQPVAAKASAE